MKKQNEDDPLWDVALEALLVETHRAHNAALGLEQLQALSTKHTIRLDDILDTLCRLAEHDVWRYFADNGVAAQPDRDMCRMLRANHRLNAAQLERVTGIWAPRADR